MGVEDIYIISVDISWIYISVGQRAGRNVCVSVWNFNSLFIRASKSKEYCKIKLQGTNVFGI